MKNKDFVTVVARIKKEQGRIKERHVKKILVKNSLWEL